MHVNKWLAQLNGLPVKKHLRRTVHKVIPEVVAGIEGQLGQLVETNTLVIEGTVETNIQVHQSVSRMFALNYLAVTADDGCVIDVRALVQKITARKKAGVELKERTVGLERPHRDLQYLPGQQ